MLSDEQLPPGYYLQANHQGGHWQLYNIRENDECQVCEINANNMHPTVHIISGSYETILDHWKSGVKKQLICTNRIIELLWHQQAPQAISDQLATWHREDEARDFATLQKKKISLFTAADEERDFREWMDALNKKWDEEENHEPIAQQLTNKSSAAWNNPHRAKPDNPSGHKYSGLGMGENHQITRLKQLDDGLNDFYAQEAEIGRQLGLTTDQQVEQVEITRYRQFFFKRDELPFTLKKCLHEAELIEEYDSDYHLTQDERTLEFHFEKVPGQSQSIFIHPKPKPHIPLDLAQLRAQIKCGRVNTEDALETFSILRSKGFNRTKPISSKKTSPQDHEETEPYHCYLWDAIDDGADYGYRDDWDYSE